MPYMVIYIIRQTISTHRCIGVLCQWYTPDGVWWCTSQVAHRRGREGGLRGVSGSVRAWVREENERRTRDK